MRKPHQACFSAGRAEARSSDPLITFEKGECVFCHLKGQLFIEFIHPAIVFHEYRLSPVFKNFMKMHPRGRPDTRQLAQSRTGQRLVERGCHPALPGAHDPFRDP